MASRTSSQASAASSVPPAHSFLEPPIEDPIPPPCHEHTRNLLKVLNCSIDILGEWLGKSWSTTHDQMCLVCSISVLVRIVTNNRWHTQPFEDTLNAPTLTFSLPRVVPQAPPMDPLTKRDPKPKPPLSPWPVSLGHHGLPLPQPTRPTTPSAPPVRPVPSSPRTPVKEVLCRHHP
jgi:hypothetical protein